MIIVIVIVIVDTDYNDMTMWRVPSLDDTLYTVLSQSGIRFLLYRYYN